ncbi:MAG: US12 family protein [Clostridia bacterium]|nr:US12 family protein [Clostridia bacterium]
MNDENRIHNQQTDGSYRNDPFDTGYSYRQGDPDFQKGSFQNSPDDPDFMGFQGYYDNSGFDETYTKNRPPNNAQFYRGYYGNAGADVNPFPTPVEKRQQTADYFMPDPKQNYNIKQDNNPFYTGIEEEQYDNAHNNQVQTFQTFQNRQNEPKAVIKMAGMELSKFAGKIYTHMFLGLTAAYITSLLVSLIQLDNKMLTQIGAGLIVTILFVHIGVGYLLARFVNKHKTASCFVIYLGYSIFTGITTELIFMCLKAPWLNTIFLLLAVTFGIMALGTNILNVSLVGFFPVSIIGLVTVGIYYLVTLAIPIPSVQAVITTIVTVLLLFLIATRGYDAKKYYEKFPDTVPEMNKTAVIAAIGIYVSAFTVIVAILCWLGKNRNRNMAYNNDIYHAVGDLFTYMDL